MMQPLSSWGGGYDSRHLCTQHAFSLQTVGWTLCVGLIKVQSMKFPFNSIPTNLCKHQPHNTIQKTQPQKQNNPKYTTPKTPPAIKVSCGI